MRFDDTRSKFIFVVLLSFLVLGTIGNLFCSTVYGAVTPALYISPTIYNAGSFGETVPIQVIAYQVYNLAKFQFQLKFNVTLLKVLNASLGSFFPKYPNSASTITVDNSHGTVTIQAQIQGSGKPVSGWGPILSVNFNASYQTTYPLSRDRCYLSVANDVLYGTGSQIITHIDQSGTYIAPYKPPKLGLTLNTSKTKYHYEDRISINGTLTGNNYPIPDALVALEVKAPNGVTVISRTLQTSSLSVQCPLQTTVTPSRSDGTPQTSFSVGVVAYFTTVITNPSDSSISGLVSVNPYDSSNATLGVNLIPVTVNAEASTTVVLGIPLQYDSRYALTPATSGSATVYANVWSDYIENGGVVLAAESSAKFTITGTAQGKPVYVNPITQGSFQANVAMHFTKGLYGLTQLPNYTVNVAAMYMGNRIAQITQIQVTTAGDINGDGKVNLADLVLLALAYGSKPGDPKWNPSSDVNSDGSVSLADLVLLAVNYSKGTV